MDSKRICKDCGIEKEENQYYLIPKGSRLEICKDCFINEIRKSVSMLQVFKKYDIPYFYDIWYKINTGSQPKDICEYMMNMSLPLYKNKTWKDSVLYEEINKTETNFYDEIIKNLKSEAKKLNNKLTTINNNNGDYSTYIAVLKSLRETLELIHKYDWQLMYCVNELDEDEAKIRKQVSVWEQNNDAQIRNCKTWYAIELPKIDNADNAERLIEGLKKSALQYKY